MKTEIGKVAVIFLALVVIGFCQYLEYQRYCDFIVNEECCVNCPETPPAQRSESSAKTASPDVLRR